MRILLMLSFVAFCTLFGQAQGLENGRCGLRETDADDLREQMFRNRANIPVSTIQQIQQQRFTIHIPVLLHLVGSSSGTGFASPSNAVAMICKLNEDFADQNLRFYLKDSLHYVMDDTIFADAYDSVAIDRMILLKDSNAVNIFINGSAGGGVAGYYSRRGDFVFILSGYANGSSTTITHEMGHFFTLPHTFFGWENIDARQLYGSSPAPDSVGTTWRRREVEYVARSGPFANCYSAGDGFCDTDADYISERADCPLVGVALDPSGMAIQPNTDFYMSYFSDNCMDSFSSEQKIAIMSSVINRNWIGFPAPNTDSLSAAAITALAPLSGASISLQNSGDSIRLQWSTQAVGPASSWIVVAERMLFGTPVATIVRKVVNQQNYLDIPSASLMPGSNYRWSVMPFSKGYHCAGYSAYFQFSTDLVNGVNPPSNIAVARLELLPNPAKNGYSTLYFTLEQAAQSSLRLYGQDGRLLSAEPLENCAAGDHLRQIDVSALPSGLYYVVLFTDKGNFSKLLVKE